VSDQRREGSRRTVQSAPVTAVVAGHRSGWLIQEVRGRQLLDSRGHPTVEVEVIVDSGAAGRASVPVGASTGRYEALELRDGGHAWGGRGVNSAIANVEGEIARNLIGIDVRNQEFVDALLVELDDTSNLLRLGANATLGVSLAVARAAASNAHLPLWEHLSETRAGSPAVPIPMVSLLDGGLHADNRLLVQELMLVPARAQSFPDALRMCAESYDELGHKLLARGLSRAVGDVGGFAAQLERLEDALELLLASVVSAGYEPGLDLAVAIDVAASELLDADGGYRHEHEAEALSSEEMIGYWCKLCDSYPIVSLEDPLGEEDWAGWRKLTEQLGDRVQLVGDDLFVTHPSLLQLGIDQHVANAVLVKPNQVGTVTRTLQMIDLARDAGYNTVMAHRSGDTEDTTVADLAVATGCHYVKFGAPARGERTAKYNQLLRIEERLDTEPVDAPLT